MALPLVIDAASNGDLNAARTLLQLGLPKLRPVSLPENVPLPDGTLTEKANAVLGLVSDGTISAQTGVEVTGIISTIGKVDEITILAEKVAMLEERIRELTEK